MFRKPQCALQSHSRKSRRSSALAMQRFKPSLEPLEQRMLLTVFNAWDFQGDNLGQYTNTEINQDFNVAAYDAQTPAVFNHLVKPSAQPGDPLYGISCADIVNDTINGQSTKVLRVTNPAEQLSSGFAMWIDLGTDREELYASYDVKFDQEFCSTLGGKLNGLQGLPVVPLTYPEPDDGFVCKLNFKEAGRIITYHYDRTYTEEELGMPSWGNGAWVNPIYMANGNWYNITQRTVMNTFTNGVANADGISEFWVDGRLIYQETGLKFMVEDSPDMKIDCFVLNNFFGGAPAETWAPTRDCYCYFDNIKIYSDPSDPTWGTHSAHDPNVILATPDGITNRAVVYDNLVTSAGTLHNASYPSNYSACLDETYLIDAGPGNVVKYQITGGHIAVKDFLLIYDGNQTDSPIVYQTYGDDVSSLSATVQSTGRYMFVRLATDKLISGTGFNGTVSFMPASSLPTAPSGLTATAVSTSQINLSWTDNSTNETGFEIRRSTANDMSNAAIININAHSGTGPMTYSDSSLQQDTTYYYRIRAINSSGHSSDVPSVVPFAGATTMWNGTYEATYYSIGADDGYLFESSENSGVGGYASATVTTSGLRMGDRSDDTQFMSIVSFDTSVLPDNATVTSATLRLRRMGVYGTSPASWGGELRVDIKGGSGFGGSTALAASDFQAAADATNIGHLSVPSANGDWAAGIFTSGMSYVNLTGTTQFRVYFQVDDNDNATDDFLAFYPGEAGLGYIPELVITFTLGNGALAAPSGLAATAVSSSQINLSWTDNSTNEDWFEIDRAMNSAFTSGLTTFTVGSNVTSYQSAGLTESTTYYYRVRSTIGGSNDSTNSATASATTQAVAAPTAPSGLGATTASSSQINLSWTDNSGNETGFEIDRATNSAFTSGLTTFTVGSNVTSYQSTGLTESTTYYYRVRSTIGGTNDSTSSSTASATTDSGGSTQVTYYSVASHDGYIVEFSENSGTGDTAMSNVTDSGIRIGDRASPANAQVLSVVSFDTSSIPDNATITSATLRLRRYTVYGTSPASWGGELRADIKGGGGFDGSTALAAGDFQATADATNVAQLSVPSTNGSWAEGTLGSGLSYINLAGTTQFRVYFQVDDNNNSTDDQMVFYPGENGSGYQPELVITYTTGPVAPTAPSNLVTTAVSTNQINLSWTDNSTNEDGFEIDRALNSTFTSGLTTVTVGANVTAYQSTGLSSGTTYYYRVRSTIGGANDSGNSNTSSITTFVPVDVTWMGTGSSIWSTAVGSDNWKKTSDATSADYFNGVNVIFNDTATGTSVFIDGADVTPSTITFNNSSKNYVVTGAKGIAGVTTTVTKQGAGTVTINTLNTYGGVTTVEAGKLVLQDIVQAVAPVLNGAGADIKGGMLVLDYSGEASPAATVNTLINNGKIHSSVATATYGLGWIDNTTTHAISIAYTVYGDANLDGSVNFSDLSKLLSNYGHAGVWADGDFNYDGMVNFADLSKLLSTYNQSIGLLIPAAITSDVPPASVETPAPLNISTVDAQASTTVLSLQPATARIGNLPADTARTTSPTLVDMSHAKQSEKIATLPAVQYQNVATALDARLAHWVLRDSVEANLRSPMLSACVPVDPQTHHSDGMLKQHRSTDGAMTVRSDPAPWVAKMVDRLISSTNGDTVLGLEDPALSLKDFDSLWDLDWIARREVTTRCSSAIDEVLAGSNT